MFIQFLANGLIAGCLFALVGLSFSLVYRPTRFLHFAHGTVVAWGAYATYLAHTFFQFPLWLCIPLGVTFSAALGCFLYWTIYRPMRPRGATDLVLLLTSLGLYTVLQNSISLAFGTETKTLRGSDLVRAQTIWGVQVTPIQMWTVVCALLCFFCTHLLLTNTRLGRQFQAVVSDLELARVDGIETDRVLLVAFAIGSAIAGLAGIMMALDVDMTPNMGLGLLMMGVVAMIVGGINSARGVLLAGFLLGLTQHIGAWRFGSQWQDAIAFFVLLTFLIFRPRGLFGQMAAKRKA